MATAKNFSDPEDVVFRSALEARRFMIEARDEERDELVKMLLMHYDEKRPDDLPPSFMAHHSASLSPLKGWDTAYGKWKPKKMVAAGPGFGEIESAATPSVNDAWARTTLAFESKAGKKSDFGMTMYNGINWLDGKAHLEEDMTFCRVYRLPKTDISNTEKLAVSRWRSLFGHKQPLDLEDSFDVEAKAVGGSKKRRKSNPVGGTLEEEKPADKTRSEVWHNFTKIYTKDPNVEYAACHHCGGMMKLTGGSECGTTSPRNHYTKCKARRRLSEKERIAEFESALFGQESGPVASCADSSLIDPTGSPSGNTELRPACYAGATALG